MIKMDALKNIYLFQNMTADEMTKIASICVDKQVIAGQDAFFSGQAADSFFVIRQGTVKIFTTTSSGDDVTIATLSSGSHFGEIPFLNGEKRTATAKATETVFLLEIPYAKLRQLLEANVGMSEKFHRAVAMFLARRLTVTTSDLSGAKESLMKIA